VEFNLLSCFSSMHDTLLDGKALNDHLAGGNLQTRYALFSSAE